MKISISFFFLLLTHFATGQNSVTGRVIDSLTRKPVPFASVYFAGTTIGTTAKEDGRFELTGFAAGKYDLTASFVGYQSTQRSLAFENTRHDITLVLFEKATQLAEVVIRPNNSNRSFDLSSFRIGFIGSEQNAAITKIKNEDDVDFDFDPHSLIFTAFTRKPLEIVNEALGYRVIYDLQVFEINYETHRQRCFGLPRFEELREKTKDSWKRERERAYNGSMMQFIHLLLNGSIEKEFAVFEFFRNPNPERPSAAILKEKIKYWTQRQLSESGVIKSKRGDSLNYYLSLQRKPELVDSIGRKITDVSTLMNAERDTVTYTGMLCIVYAKEAEEKNFALEQGRSAKPYQTSIIHIFQPVRIYDNGYYEDQQSIFFEGYMGWSSKIAGLLPLGYKP